LNDPGGGGVIRRRGVLFVVSAPSGAGKTTLCRELRLRLPDLAYSVSYTTRPPRTGEINGTDFHFVTEAEFQRLRERGEFAEWAVVHGNLYGTRTRVLEAALEQARDILLDIDTQGAGQLRHRYPEAVLVFIVAPSLAELEQRLLERRANNPGDIRHRLARARDEIALWRQYDYLIVNRDIKEAAEQLTAIVVAERARTSRLGLGLPDLDLPRTEVRD
jgi:guanylate kinase